MAPRRAVLFQHSVAGPSNSEDIHPEHITRVVAGLKQWEDLLDQKAELVADLWVLDIM